jgi:hypothetical protein
MKGAGRGLPALAGLAALFLGGCGAGRSAGTGTTPPGDAIPGLDSRRCVYASAESELPSFGQLTRSGTRGNIALWGREMAPDDTVQLSIRYGGDGRVEWVRAIRTTLSGERTRALEGLVLEALSDTGEPNWGVRLLVVGGDLAGLEPSVVCPPRITGQPRRMVGLPVTWEGRQALYQARGLRFPVRISLDDRGRILDVELRRRIGQTEADQFLMDYIRSLRFEPRRHDGIGIPSVVEELIALPRRSW